MPLSILLRTLGILVALTTVAAAQPANKKKYHFSLAAVNVKPEVKQDVAMAAMPRVSEQLKKAFESHPQLVGTLEGAPDWKTAADAYRKYLTKKRITSAFHVTVDITDASEELQPTDRPNTQRLVVRVSIHMLGETMPGRTMGFTGDGSATIKQEIGKKLKDRDRKFAWDDAAKAAIDDAMVTVFKQLAAGVAPKSQKK
jgi:hypothetical protein